MRLPGINSDAAWKLYGWLCFREGMRWFRANAEWKTVEVTEEFDDGTVWVCQEEIPPPPCFWTYCKQAMYWLGFIPF